MQLLIQYPLLYFKVKTDDPGNSYKPSQGGILLKKEAFAPHQPSITHWKAPTEQNQCKSVISRGKTKHHHILKGFSRRGEQEGRNECKHSKKPSPECICITLQSPDLSAYIH